MHLDSTTYRATSITPRTDPPSVIVVHSTEGLMPGCAEWLCHPKSKVSTDYIVARTGVVYQLAPAHVYTWHAGVSALPGSPERARFEAGEPNYKPSINPIALGVELEHVEGGTPYTGAQKNSLDDLLTLLMDRYPGANILTHADVALPAGRKHDPTDWPANQFYAWVGEVLTPTRPAPTRYSPSSPIILSPSTPAVSGARIKQAMEPFFKPGADGVGRMGDYTRMDVYIDMLSTYWTLADRVGLDPLILWAQMLHETDYLRSFWASRPQRNPAGIGVDGHTQSDKPANTKDWAFDFRLGLWRRGVSFLNWREHSVPAHTGRVLRYALPPETGTITQRALMTKALSYRSLPAEYWGCAPTLQGLEGRWAVPGDNYADAIARICNHLLGEV